MIACYGFIDLRGLGHANFGLSFFPPSMSAQVGIMQEQNGSLAEKLNQAEARLTEAQESSSSKAQSLAVELEQARSQSKQIQVISCTCSLHAKLLETS